MTDLIIITTARAALSAPTVPQFWTCSACRQTMDVTFGLAHILYDCPGPPACLLCTGAIVDINPLTELCPTCANAIEAGLTCQECGLPLDEADIAAGEVTCVGCGDEGQQGSGGVGEKLV